LHLSVDSDDIWFRKGTWQNPFLSLRFDPIQDSAGKTYYVWVERGPSDANDVLALWSMKSYSKVPAIDVVRAFMRESSFGRHGASATAAGWALLLAALIAISATAVALFRSAAEATFHRGLEEQVWWQRLGSDGI